MTGVDLTPLVQNAHFFSGRLRVKSHAVYGHDTNFHGKARQMSVFVDEAHLARCLKV